ncbi:MAG: hypothetical protein ACREH8_02370 [Opitutaceae bacterium]
MPDIAAAEFEDEASLSWPDEAAESSFRAEARERGETGVATKPQDERADASDSHSLPPLEELVLRIPAEIREALEDLFRAKFTEVRRIPAKALREGGSDATDSC